MRLFLKTVLFLIGLSPIFLGVALWLSFSDQALINNNLQLSHKDIAHARTLLKNNDPRYMQAGTTRTVYLSEQDLNLASNYILHKNSLGGVSLQLDANKLNMLATFEIPLEFTQKMPKRPNRRFLNIEMGILEQDNEITIKTLKLGQLSISSVISKLVLRHGLPLLDQTGQYQLVLDIIKRIDLQPQQLKVTYQWNPEVISYARTTFLSSENLQSIAVYYDQLIALQAKGIGNQGSILLLLKPLFQLAQERSASGNPINENRALLTLLGTWASGQDIKQLIPEMTQQPPSFRLKLAGRKDFAQHYLISAALAAGGDGSLADAVGLFKEVSDSKSSSGFSFTDIAADRAGSNLGSKATSSLLAARLVQTYFTNGVTEQQVMPSVKGLPEHMSRIQFEKRFGSVGSDAYNIIMAEIEKRISLCCELTN